MQPWTHPVKKGMVRLGSKVRLHTSLWEEILQLTDTCTSTIHLQNKTNQSREIVIVTEKKQQHEWSAAPPMCSADKIPLT